MYLIAFFFSTPSGHAQWAHTCPTLPQGSSEKMPTTSESPPLTLRASSASFVYRSFPERTGDRANGPVPSVFFSRGGGAKKRSSLIPLPVTIPLLSHHYEKRSARMRKRRRWQRRCRNARLFFPVQDELHFSDANWRVAAVPPLSNDARCECRARHCSAKIAPPGGITKFTIRTPTAKNPAVSCPPFCRMCGMETCADNPCPGGLLPPGAGDC